MSQGYSPSLQQSVQLSSELHRGGGSSLGPSLMEVSAFMTEQLKEQLREQRGHDASLRQAANAERQELEAQLQQQRAEAKAERHELEAQLQQQRAEAKAESDQLHEMAHELKLREREQAVKLREQQLVALQARLEALHATKLLADEELHTVEDAIADSEEAAEGDRVPALVSLSAKMVSDRAFARQLQRKKWL